MGKTIKINPKKIWEIGKGHNEHRSGSGIHKDSRKKRQNTRAAKYWQVMKEYKE